jgi:hypothetical protein
LRSTEPFKRSTANLLPNQVEFKFDGSTEPFKRSTANLLPNQVALKFDGTYPVICRSICLHVCPD